MSRRVLPSLVLALTMLVACGGDAPEETAQPATVEDAMAQMSAQMANQVSATGAGSVEPIPAADLAAQLPDELGGFPASNQSHQDVGAMGMKMSTATAEYGDGTRRIDVSVTDAGGMGKMAPMAAAWAMVDINRTTADGFERTMRFEGHKGFESSSTSGGRLRTELSVLVGERVIVQLKGVEVELDELKKAAASLDLDALARGS
jgi:hypothetical protein